MSEIEGTDLILEITLIWIDFDYILVWIILIHYVTQNHNTYLALSCDDIIVT